MVKAEKLSRGAIGLSFVLLLGVLSSGCVTLTCAYIPDQFLTGGWHENTALRNTGLQLFGMEKWCGVSYEIKGKYPALLTITTLKTLVLADEAHLLESTRTLINDTFQETVTFVPNATGTRMIENDHETLFITYEGRDLVQQEQVRIIGEVWNCPSSGTSLLCVGIAYLTNDEIPGKVHLDEWQKMIQDPTGAIEEAKGDEGLIFHVWCH